MHLRILDSPSIRPGLLRSGRPLLMRLVTSQVRDGVQWRASHLASRRRPTNLRFSPKGELSNISARSKVKFCRSLGNRDVRPRNYS
jgi:hypothetical protein